MSKIVKTKHNRILKLSDDHQQITLPDKRFYLRNGEYYPSITYVLQTYPKGPHFEEWLKRVGYAANHIVEKASKEGTQVHNMVEEYLRGDKLEFLTPRGVPLYPPHIWQMFLRFVEFWETFKPKLIHSEVSLFSDELKISGTCDLVCEIDGELWIIDLKTSNYLSNTFDLQTAVYGKCYEEGFGIKPDRYGILWLKSSKRRPRKGHMQGKGWEMYESKRSQEENLEIFKSVRKIFDIENPRTKPQFTEFPATAQLKEEE